MTSTDIIAICASVAASALSCMSVFVAVLANAQARKTRNVEALLSLQQRSMTPEMQEVRGELLHGIRFEAVAADGSNPFGLVESDLAQRRHELHKLMSIYEALGAVTKARLVDFGLVRALFPHAIADCYDKASSYIDGYRDRHGQNKFAYNFEWLAGQIKTGRTSCIGQRLREFFIGWCRRQHSGLGGVGSPVRSAG